MIPPEKVAEAAHERFARPVSLPRELILASAGSGKTFRISSSMIGLLARGAPPEEVLASTFTRKAAGQILERVLVRLAHGVCDPKASAELAGHALLGTANVAEPLSAATEPWLRLLEGLTRELHRLNVVTLDAFFVRAARVFSHELGLPPSWGIGEPATDLRLRSEALQEVLRGEDSRELVELVRRVNRGDVNRSVHRALLARLEELVQIHHELDPDAPEPWTSISDTGAPAVADLRAAAAGLADAFDALERPLTRSGSPRKHFGNALTACATALRTGDWDTLVENGLCKRVLEDGKQFDSAQISDDIDAAVREVLDLARAAFAPTLAAQGRAMGRLARVFADAYARRQRDEGAYQFHDLTRLFGGSDPIAERPDLWYRLDMRTRHILLDEFQDTSRAQWEALEPLVEELLSGHEGERGAVIVADPKQSIYGWRGAEPAIVHDLGERFDLSPEVLATSWRSSPVVLDFVNDVFRDLPTNAVLADDPVCAETAETWMRAFEPHRPSPGNVDLPGHIRVTVGPQDYGVGTERPRLFHRAAELVDQLRNETGGYGIGVLTRTNTAVAHMIHALRRLNVPASEEGGNPLTDSAATAALLALLRLADHPGDRIARYHVTRSPVGESVGLVDPADERAGRRLAQRLRLRLIEDGYGRTLSDLVTQLIPASDMRERRRLAQLVELAFRYDDHATLRPSDFIRLVESIRVEDPTSADIRVMTVHQAKGLEFDIVVLPELDTPLLGSGMQPAALPFRPGPASRVQAVYPAGSRGLRRLFPQIQMAADQAKAAETRDGLSVLYVALTRARYALHAVLAPDPESGPSQARTPARLVREALALDGPMTENAVLYETGDAAWSATLSRTAPTRPTPASIAERAAPPTPHLRKVAARHRILARRSPSELEGGATVDLAFRLRLDTTPNLERGSVVHAWLQELGWIEDGPPADADLRAIARRVGAHLTDTDTDALLAAFHDWLAAPATRLALSRASYDQAATLLREAPFVHRDKNTVLEGIIDRLVLFPSADGGIARVDIIDYKTDNLSADDRRALQQRTEHYRPQIDAYRRAMAARYRVHPDDVRARLLFVQAGEVRTV